MAVPCLVWMSVWCTRAPNTEETENSNSCTHDRPQTNKYEACRHKREQEGTTIRRNNAH